MKKFLTLIYVLAFVSVVFVSCSGEVDIVTQDTSRIFVLNEGNDNGSVSMITDSGTVVNNYFESVNGLPLGKFPQSMAVNDKYAFIVVTTFSGAGYVEIVEVTTCEHYDIIEGLSYPRDIAFYNNKAYISNGNGADANFIKQNNEVYVLDLSLMEITDTISVGAGPEKIVVSNGKLYVANSGGWSNDDNTVSVIDPSKDEVVETISVGYCPRDMVVDSDGDIWVFCGGKPDYSNYPVVSFPEAAISKINNVNSLVNNYSIL